MITTNPRRSIITGKSALGTNYIDVDVSPDGGLMMNQNTTVDVASSSTANLAASAFFTGPAVSDLYFTAVQFIFKADQNCLIFVEQSPDGTNWDISDQFDFFTSSGNGSSNTVQLTGSYYRIRVKNVGIVSTTFLRLQVIQIPFLSSLPRSLDQFGNLRTSIYNGITDNTGFTSYNTPFGESLSVPTYKLIGGIFTDGVLDTSFWIPAIGTGGSATVANAAITLSTGTTANNTVSLTSVKVARYIAGISNKYIGLVRLSDAGAAANNTRRWGAYSTTDGAFFQVSNGVFSIGTRINSVDTLISNGSFNGNIGASYALTSNYTKFNIVYTAYQLWFYVDDILLHTIKFLTANWTSIYHLPIRFDNDNTGGSIVNVTMEARAGIIDRLGIPQVQSRGFFQQGLTAGATIKIGPGNIHNIVLSGIVNNSVITLYDNTTATGTVLWTSGPMTNNTMPFDLDMGGIQFSIGLSIAITAAAANALVVFE